MQIDAYYSIMLPHTITHTAYPLEKLLNKHNSYNIFKKQLKIGKAHLFNAQLNTISITHWIYNIDYTHIEYYPTPSLTCSPCSGCNLNSNRIKNQCTFDISATLSTQFWRRKISNNPNTLLKFNANYLDLIYATANRHPTHIPPTPNILIYNDPVFELFDPNSSS